MTVCHRRRFLQIVRGAAACSCLLLLPGCSWVDQYRGEGFAGEDATWGEAYRPKSRGGEQFFFDEKSTQIERSLGL